ncbi:hypothetical protein E2C01_081444 [Portunus trituberculatus]|uniref:Uncharacterized protein n=1 Tax=Portunus trituberculatus TaxID=210409 RepID=A0A5B7IWP2_PORTR|nr:hypothetical protein [Portunus trituberculatus]
MAPQRESRARPLAHQSARGAEALLMASVMTALLLFVTEVVPCTPAVTGERVLRLATHRHPPPSHLSRQLTPRGGRHQPRGERQSLPSAASPHAPGPPGECLADGQSRRLLG